MFYIDFYSLYRSQRTIPGIKCFSHKCHPSVFLFYLKDTNNVTSDTLHHCISPKSATLAKHYCPSQRVPLSYINHYLTAQVIDLSEPKNVARGEIAPEPLLTQRFCFSYGLKKVKKIKQIPTVLLIASTFYMVHLRLQGRPIDSKVENLYRDFYPELSLFITTKAGY